jgi:4-hydroxyphenylpyruvate dioxygenase
MTSGNGLVLWDGTVRNKGFDERIEAAVAGGFSEMSLSPLAYKGFVEGGLRPKEMRAMMEDAGVRVAILDPLTKWLPRWEPPADIAKEWFDFFDFDEDEIFRIADSLGVDSICTIEALGNEFPAEAAAESFAGVCDRAAAHGWNVILEFIPVFGIRDLASAWEVVRLADRRNGGLDFDTWHYFRGNPDDELLSAIPGEKIFAVEVADARREVRGSSIFDDLFHHRLPPGEGDFELVELMRLLDRTGGLSSVGIEMFSDEFDALPAEEAGRRAGTSLRALLDEAVPEGRRLGQRL